MHVGMSELDIWGEMYVIRYVGIESDKKWQWTKKHMPNLEGNYEAVSYEGS